MADNQTQGKNGSVFISYSRKDKEFVRKLYDGLVTNDVRSWVDWEGIPLSADWMDEITRAVDGADAFLVVLSPDWLASKVCADELELGLKSKKKLIPILYRDPEKGTSMHEKLAATNWVYMRAQDDFDGTLPKLIDTIGTDLGWVRQHTRLLQRALEWNGKNRDSSFLLQGADLDEGESWMAEAAQNPKRDVLPLQAEYIAASRKDAVRRQRMLLTGVSLALVVSIILAVLAVFQWDAATKSEAKAVEKEHARATQQVIAQENEKLAKKNEMLAINNEALAKKNETLAKNNAILALAQRNAAEAKLYQGKSGELDTSTLLAIDSWQRAPSFQAEEILRQNITYMPMPVAQMSHTARINTILFSPDGQRFVTSSEDGSACVWNLKDGQKQYCVKHDKSVNYAVFSKDGKWLATSSEDGSARLWNAADGSLFKRYDLGGPVWEIKFSPNSEWLVIAHDKGMKAVNLVNHLQKDRDVVLPSAAYVLAFSPDGKWVGIGTDSGAVFIWVTGSMYTNHGPTHSSEVLDIGFTPDSQYLISAGADSTARVADTKSGKELTVFHTGDWLEDIDISPNGGWFAGASDDNNVWIWDYKNKTGESKMRLSHTGFVQKVKISPNGLWIASTGFDQTLRIWDARSGSQMFQVDLGDVGAGLTFSPDGKYIVVGNRKGNVSIWDITALSAQIGSIEFSEYVHDVKLSPDGQRLFANSDDQKIWFLDLPNILSVHSTESAKELFTAKGLTYNMDVSPDSNWLITAESQNDRAILYDFAKKKTIDLNHDSTITGVAFIPGITRAAVSDKDGKVILWDAATGKKQAELVNDAAVLGIAVSPDGRYLVAGLNGLAATTVWDLKTKEKVANLKQVGAVNSVAFSKDGKLVATGDDLGVINVWNEEDFALDKPVQTMHLSGKVVTMLFSVDDRWLVVGSSDNYALFFDTASGDEISRIPHIGPVTSLAFSADGKWLFTVSLKNIQIWDVAKLNLIPSSKLIDTACSRLVANFNSAEWQTLFSTEDYRFICPNLPQGKD